MNRHSFKQHRPKHDSATRQRTKRHGIPLVLSALMTTLLLVGA
jgi:hypothetical protein